MKEYKKRAQGSWNKGKGNKGDGAERQVAKRYITSALSGTEEKIRGKNKTNRKKAKNKKASLEARINWYERTIAVWEKAKSSDSFLSHLRFGLELSKKELEEKLGRKK